MAGSSNAGSGDGMGRPPWFNTITPSATKLLGLVDGLRGDEAVKDVERSVDVGLKDNRFLVHLNTFACTGLSTRGYYRRLVRVFLKGRKARWWKKIVASEMHRVKRADPSGKGVRTLAHTEYSQDRLLISKILRRWHGEWQSQTVWQRWYAAPLKMTNVVSSKAETMEGMRRREAA
ncbi:hypothetical protein EDD18DRAFT_1361117 [Armillaria luteobubalina]|uniref:Uncharacterized protein n=1 Tax=Armillaria luteobubalina TaxID=153913 RepID=A0AA39UFS6_9AGAR|nr:hypothetical protein EDD18DRAFT_1361117 [Armillaria luteobubalina]